MAPDKHLYENRSMRLEAICFPNCEERRIRQLLWLTSSERQRRLKKSFSFPQKRSIVRHNDRQIAEIRTGDRKRRRKEASGVRRSRPPRPPHHLHHHIAAARQGLYGQVFTPYINRYAIFHLNLIILILGLLISGFFYPHSDDDYNGFNSITRLIETQNVSFTQPPSARRFSWRHYS